jgi:hypothetical protein
MPQPIFNGRCAIGPGRFLHLRPPLNTHPPNHPPPGVPIIADQRMLKTYTMLDRKAVFFQVRAGSAGGSV